jgi:hypothetical protein
VYLAEPTITAYLLMGCGCGKKKAQAAAIVAGSVVDSIDAEEWGPVYWKLLHCLSVRIGLMGDVISDTDQARAMEYLVGHLVDVIPCDECQGHARTYIEAHPIRWLGLRNSTLRVAVERWLLDFHNDVRARLSQAIEVADLAVYEAAYEGCTMAECEMEVIARAAKYAIDHNIVKPANWKRWMTEFKKLRLSVGA